VNQERYLQINIKNGKQPGVNSEYPHLFEVGLIKKAGGLFHKRPGSRMRVIDHKKVFL